VIDVLRAVALTLVDEQAYAAEAERAIECLTMGAK
jgi:hypothetical protein